MKKNNHLYRIVITVIRKHIFIVLGLIVSIIGAIIFGIIPPVILGHIVDGIEDMNNGIIMMIITFFLSIAFSGLFDSAKEVMITIFGQKVTHQLRTQMCQKLSKLPASYYAENETGVIESVFVNDVDTIETLFNSGIVSMIVDSFKVVSIVIVIFMKSVGLGLLLLLAIPVLAVLTFVVQRGMISAQIKNRRAVANVNSKIPETIRNIRMIHIFHREKYMAKRYDGYIKDSYDAINQSNFYDAIYSPVIVTVSACIVAVMMILSGKSGEMQQFFGMTAGTAVTIISYVGKVFDPLESIGMEIQNIQSAIAGIFRINIFLNEEERKTPEECIDYSCKCENMIEINNITFAYETGNNILEDYSMIVKSGENRTIVGRTGIGKSTVFKLILGLYEPQEGEALIHGRKASDIKDSEKRKLFGYVSQGISFVPGNIRDQITLGDSTISDEQVYMAADVAGIHNTILSLAKGYDTECAQGILSMGQFQLLAIARAIVNDPEILLLDEMASNMDSNTEKSVIEALKRVSANRTVLSVSHRMSSKALRIKK